MTFTTAYETLSHGHGRRMLCARGRSFPIEMMYDDLAGLVGVFTGMIPVRRHRARGANAAAHC
jgi:hypothetical protein